MTRPVRVLYFIGDVGPGGSETHLARLLVALDRSRVEPALMLMRAEGSHLPAIRAASVPIYDVTSRTGTWRRFERVARIVSFLREARPDILHAYGFPSDVYAPILCSPFRRTLVVTTRRGNQGLRWKRLCYRLTNPLVHRVVCVSTATQKFAQETEGLAASRSTVIVNGIDVSPFRPREEYQARVARIGTLGRIHEVKGQDLLLEAFAGLGRADLTLTIGGLPDSPWGEALHASAKNQPAVSLPGEISDVPSFLASLDLFVLPSRSEGMSNALLEAMAAGLPIVATDVGSTREVLAGGESGLLVGPDARSIADGISALIDDPARRARLGRAARQRVEAHYGFPAMVKAYEDLYDELVRGGRA